MLSKTRTVLERAVEQKNGEHFTFFGQKNEDETGFRFDTGIYIRNQDVADMGDPYEITVTVEPGNVLGEDIEKIDTVEPK